MKIQIICIPILIGFSGKCYSVLSRCAQSEQAADRRSKLFSQEKQRQIDLIKRVEKIKVEYCGVPENQILYLNKGLSTPFNVAQRKLSGKKESQNKTKNYS